MKMALKQRESIAARGSVTAADAVTVFMTSTSDILGAVTNGTVTQLVAPVVTRPWLNTEHSAACYEIRGRRASLSFRCVVLLQPTCDLHQ